MSEGNENAFRTLFDQYRDKIFSIAHKITKEDSSAEDVVQEVFIKLWLNKEKLPHLDNFAAYLNTVTRNHIFSQLRRIATEEAYLTELITTANAERFSSDEIAYGELKKMLTNAIANLPPQQKKVYQLGKLEGKKYDEIAAMLNISKETVKDHMTKATASIKRQLLRNEGLLTFAIVVIHFFYST